MDRIWQNFIDGRWKSAVGGGERDSLEPSTGLPWARIADSGPEDVDEAVRAARRSFDEGRWPRCSAAERAGVLRRIAAVLRDHGAELARTESRDNGKPIRETGALIPYLGSYYDYYADLIATLGGELVATDKPAMTAFKVHEPLGVVAAITPWNSPLYLLATKLAPALAAGNTVVIKPSEHASCSTLAFVERLAEIVPAGVVNVVTGDGIAAGAALVSHPGVDRVAFTGGVETGRRVVEGSARNLARLTLELGGKSAQLVFDDADLTSAVNGILAGTFAATGQSCVAGSRVYVQDGMHDRLLETLKERTRAVKVGDPLDPETEIGPLAVDGQVERLDAILGEAVAAGAELTHAEGDLPEAGWFYRPTVATNVPATARLNREELFGPVASVMRFGDEDDGVRLANDSRFGLAAGLWTTDGARVQRLTPRINAGIVWANTYRMASPSMPFGGRGDSGYGVEGGVEGFLSYTQMKTAWINASPDPMPDPFKMR